MNSRMRKSAHRALAQAAVVLAYCAAGVFAGIYRFSPGEGSLFYPSAGLIAAIVFVAGSRYAPGLVVGVALYVLILMARDGVDGDGLQIVLINQGITLAEGVSVAWLIRRTAPEREHVFDNARSTLLSLLLVVPAVCAIGTSASVWVDLLAPRSGVMDPRFKWLTWWTGDTLGMLVLLPVTVAWMRREQPVWRERLRLMLPANALLLSVLAVVMYQERLIDAGFRSQRHEATVSELQQGLVDRMQEIERYLTLMARQQAELPATDQASFARRIEAAGLPKGVRAVTWSPVVTRSERAAFEQRMAQDHGLTGFELREALADGRTVRASEREQYLPVAYAFPLEGNRAALGLDIAAGGVRRAAVDRAIASNALIVSAPLRVVQASDVESSILMVIPVRPPGVGRVTGVLVAVAEVSRLLNSLDRYILAGVSVRLVDADAGRPAVVTPPARDDDLRSTVQLVAGQRQWLLEVDTAATEPSLATSLTSGLATVLGYMVIAPVQIALLLLGGARSRLRDELLGRAREIRELSERLRATEARLYTIVDCAPFCVKIVDRDGMLRHMNPSGLAMLGALGRESDVIGKPIGAFVSPGFRELVADRNSRVLGGAQTDLVYRLADLDGNERWVRSFSFPISDALTYDTQVLSFTFDSSAERSRDVFDLQIQQALERLQTGGTIDDLLEDIVAGLGEAVPGTTLRIISTFDHRWRTAGIALPVSELEQLLRERDPAKGPLEFEEIDGDSALADHAALLNHGGVASLRAVPITGREGSAPGWVLATRGVPGPMDPLSQRVTGICAALAGLAIQRHLEREQLNHARLAFDAIDSPLMLTHPDGRMAAVNPAFERLTGYALADLLGRSPIMLRPDDYDRETYREMWHALTWDTSWSGVLWIQHFDGFRFAARVRIQTVTDPATQSVWRLGSFRAVSERSVTKEA